MKKVILYFSILLSIFSCSPKEILSPQEVNETVFVGSFDDNLYALDAQTGKMKWAFDSKDDMYSPTVEGNMVYIHSGGQYKLYAINILDGLKKWDFRQSVFIRESPLIQNGIIYTSIGGNFSLTSRIYALDIENGAKKWEFTTPGWFDNSTVINNDLIYSVGNSYKTLNGIDKMTGEIKWQHNNERIYTSPFVSDGLIYYGSNRKVTILESKTGEVKKQILLDSSTYFLPIVYRNNFFVLNGNKKFCCYDTNSGNKLWEFALNKNIYITFRPTIDNETIYINSEKSIIAIDINTGLKKWEFETGGEVISYPTIANGIIYFGSRDKKVYALNADDGTKKWEFLTMDRIESTPCVISKSGKVYYAGQNRLNQP